MSTKKNGKVFGTFDYSYDISEFERERSDGTTIIDLNPECRVFIFGVELSKDILSVDINYGENGGHCSISLANPRGKYELSKLDLIGKWREDKDILAAYGYSRFDHLKYDKPNFLSNIASKAFPAYVNQTAKTVGKLFSSQKRTIPNALATRMIFETKFYSALDKRVGDIVFDYRDPVYIFLKGRFSPFMYFGFSGIITAFDNEDTYGSNKTINLRCEDPLYLWKKQKISRRGPIIGAAFLDAAVANSGSKTKLEYMHPSTKYSFDQLIRFNAFGPDYLDKVRSNSLCPNYITEINASVENDMRKKLKEQYKFESQFMFTDIVNADSIPNPADDSAGPNAFELSPWQMFYPQYIDIACDKFNEKTTQFYYNNSVRFWEYDQTISPNSNVRLSGWKDSKAFGVAGIHPALSWDFVNNFNILPSIWYETTKNLKNVEKLVISPVEKVRELVIGSPTESRKNYAAMGSNVNVFRPRLFLLIPRRFSDRSQGFGPDGLQQLDLFKGDFTTAYEYLKSVCDKVEYRMYSSQMGDIFIEPEMYDMHPLEFHDKIESRSILMKDPVPIDFRYTGSLTYDNQKVIRKDRAYFFNSKANHPNFIMEKDRFRVTESFKPELIFTHTEVRGAVGTMRGTNALTEGVFKTSLLSNFNFLSFDNENANLATGRYIAIGLHKSILNKTASRTAVDNQILEQAETDYRETLENLALSEYFNSTLSKVIDDAIDHILMIDKSGNDMQWQPNVVQAVVEADTLSTNTDRESGSGQVSEDQRKSNLKEALLNNLVPELIPYITYGKETVVVGGKTNYVASPPKFNIDTDIISRLAGLSEESDFIQFSENTGSSYGKFAVFLSSFIKLAEPTMLVEVAEIRNKWDTFQAEQEKKDLNVPTLRTMADFKAYERLGLYNPRQDMVRRYGYNAAPTLENYYIRSGLEANLYAIIYFQKMFGKAFTISLNIIGRPEFFLNRPYYCEAKDSIGLLNSYRINFSVGGDFNSSAELTYVRKNSLTFNYTNKEMDDVSGDVANNKFFANEALNYYRGLVQMRNVSQLGSSIGNTLGSGAASMILGSGDSSNKKVASSVVGKSVGDYLSKTLTSNLPKGGLYSSHDWIGHLDFDNNMNDAIVTMVSNETTRGIYGSQEISIYDSLELYKICSNIKTLKEEITSLEAALSTAIYDLSTLKFQYEETLTKEDPRIGENPDLKEYDIWDKKVRAIEYAAITKETEIQDYITRISLDIVTLYGKAVKIVNNRATEPDNIESLTVSDFAEGEYFNLMSLRSLGNPRAWIPLKDPVYQKSDLKKWEVPFYLKPSDVVLGTSVGTGQS